MKVFRDSVSGFTHMGGAVLSIVGAVFLGIKANGGLAIAAAIVYGVTMVLLFSFSCTYHLVSGPKKLISAFRIVDHCMIYILIAGTYTPVVALVLNGWVRIAYFSGIWACALIGIALKIFFTGKFRTVSTILYCVMGLLIALTSVTLYKTAGFWFMFFLIMGGVMYISGAVFYAIQKPKPRHGFGFHEIFHIFVLLGAGCHYVMTLCYVL